MEMYYVIQHKATKEIMPLLDRDRGYSWWNPSNENSKMKKRSLGIPRILKSEKQARQVISQWNALPNARTTGYETEGGYDYDIVTTPDGRKKEDLEIVPINIVYGNPL